MPELLLYDYNNPQELNRLEEVEKKERETIARKNKAYYLGQHTKPLKVKPDDSDDNVIINLVRKTVNQSLSMLIGKMPTFTVENEAAQIVLDDIMKASDVHAYVYDLVIQGALCGHVFTKMAYLSMDSKLWITKLVSLKPEIVTAYWQPDDMDKINAYKIEWTKGDDTHREDIVRMDEKSWMIVQYAKSRSSNWQHVGDDVVWKFPFPPVVDWKNLPSIDNYYGEPDITNLGINDQINFAASNINRILKFHAHPRTIGVGIEKGGIEDTTVDGLWTIANPDAKISNLEMQSDLSSSMSFLDSLQNAFNAEHRTVDMASMKDKIGQLTNFGLKVMFKEALDKANDKRLLYGAGLTTLLQNVLAVHGYDEEVAINWGAELPFNDREEIEGLEKELALGIVSKNTAAEDRGRDWEYEQERMKEEKASEQLGLGAVLAGAMREFDRGDNA